MGSRVVLPSLFSLALLICTAFGADHCKDVLDANLMSRFESGNLKTLDEQIKNALSYDRETLKKIAKKKDASFGISIPLAEALISFDAKDKGTLDTLETLKEKVQTAMSGSHSTLEMETIRRQIAPEAAIKAWKDCMNKGLNADTSGNLNGTFSVNLIWNRRDASDRPIIKIAQLTLLGAEIIPPLRFAEGTKLKEFTALDQLFRRVGKEKGSIRISSEGYGAVEVELPASPIDPYRIRTNITTMTTKTRAISSPTFVPRHVGGSDTDFSGNGPKMTAKAYLELSSDKRRIYLQVSLHAKETKSDWTEANETNAVSEPYLVYETDANSTIKSINGAHSDKWHYTDGDHDPDVFKPHAFFSQKPKSSILRMIRRPTLDNSTDNGFVNKWTLVGDTKGNESGSRTSVQVDVNPVQITVERMEIQREIRD